MIINVKVKTRMNEQKIESLGNNRYLVYLKSEPEHNKANIELLNMLAKYFTTPVARIKIKHGMSGDEKMIEIL